MVLLFHFLVIKLFLCCFIHLKWKKPGKNDQMLLCFENTDDDDDAQENNKGAVLFLMHCQCLKKRLKVIVLMLIFVHAICRCNRWLFYTEIYNN